MVECDGRKPWEYSPPVPIKAGEAKGVLTVVDGSGGKVIASTDGSRKTFYLSREDGRSLLPLISGNFSLRLLGSADGDFLFCETDRNLTVFDNITSCGANRNHFQVPGRFSPIVLGSNRDMTGFVWGGRKAGFLHGGVEVYRNGDRIAAGHSIHVGVSEDAARVLTLVHDGKKRRIAINDEIVFEGTKCEFGSVFANSGLTAVAAEVTFNDGSFNGNKLFVVAPGIRGVFDYRQLHGFERSEKGISFVIGDKGGFCAAFSLQTERLVILGN